MRKIKKLIALTCAATMLIPSIAFASETGTFGGDITVENSTPQEFRVPSVVLPTIASDSYNFTIDADEIFATVDGENYNATDADGVWFSKETTPAKLVVNPDSTATNTYKLYAQSKVADTDFTKFKAAIGTKKLAEITAEILKDFYVWIPNGTTGNGQFVALTVEDITNNKYFTLTFDKSSLAFTGITANQHTSGSAIFDGKLYCADYVEITAEDAVEYYVAGESASLKPGLFVTATTEAGEGEKLAAALGSAAGQLTYEAAEFTNKGTSSTATIVNKSTFDIAVSVNLTVANANGLTFVAEDALANEDTDASMYMAITNNTSNVVAVSGTADESGAYATAPSATAYYVLTGTGVDASKYTLYQGTETDPITGSHKYYKYLNPNLTYTETAFDITAAVVGSDDWDGYYETLTSAESMPEIQVVYSWVEVNVDNAEEFTYKDEVGNVYDAASSSDGWATFTTAGHQHAWDSEWTTTATVHYHECTNVDGECDIEDYTTAPAGAAYGTHTDEDDDNACDICSYVIAEEYSPRIETTSYTKVEGEDLVIEIDLGAGDLAATDITKITYLNSSGATRELTADRFSFDGSTLTINSEYTDTLTSSRDFTIVFNDSEATSITITFVVE